jgi:hypothetical protein
MSAATPAAYCARLLKRTRADVAAAIAEAVERRDEGEDSSGRGRLIHWIAAIDDSDTAGFLRFMADESLEDATRLLTAIDEHAHAMQLVMEANVASTSLVTLQRALIEAVLTLCYVHDAAAAPARTMLRILARQLDAFEGSERNSAAFPRTVIGDRAAEIHEGVEGFRAMLAWFGIELTPVHKGSTPSLAYDGERENIMFNATDAAKRYLKADAHHWNMGSGGTHSKAWFLPSVLDGLTDEKLSSEVEQFGAPTFAVLASARVLLTAVAAHSGVSTTPAREAVFMREKALMAFVQGNDPSPISLAEFESRPADWKPEVRDLTAFYRRRPR